MGKVHSRYEREVVHVITTNDLSGNDRNVPSSSHLVR